MLVCRVWTGAEEAVALGLPEGGGDPGPDRGRPEQTATDLPEGSTAHRDGAPQVTKVTNITFLGKSKLN